ncbi:MAG: hypothetical protein JXR31_11185 [Prolixibacteraceae bacterium]|nr:hypothetical protein [Prolixibacteraceae bacterium]
MGNYNLRQWLFGLLIDCPMGKRLPDCPMNKYKGIPTTKKINLTFEIPKTELNSILLHHRKCLAERESVIIKKQLLKAAGNK